MNHDDSLWVPIINDDKTKAVPKSFPRILFYGQYIKHIFETEQECQEFCDNSIVIKENPLEDFPDCRQDLVNYVIKPKE